MTGSSAVPDDRVPGVGGSWAFRTEPTKHRMSRVAFVLGKTEHQFLPTEADWLATEMLSAAYGLPLERIEAALAQVRKEGAHALGY